MISNRVALPDQAGNPAPGGWRWLSKPAWPTATGCGSAGADRSRSRPRRRSRWSAGGIRYVLTDLPPKDVQEYYKGYANRVLWPVLRYRLDLAEFSPADFEG